MNPGLCHRRLPMRILISEFIEDMAAAGMLTMESANGVVTLRFRVSPSRRQAP